jgi:hypothetical protein
LRFIAVALLGIWLGGVIFYGAVVIPTAHDVMGSHREIGFVTRRVTGVSNVLGSGTLAVLLLHLGLTWSPRSRSGRWWAGSTLAVMILAQTALFFMRAGLDGLLDSQAMQVLDRSRFLWLHERYLNVTAALCLAGAVHLWTLVTPVGPKGPIALRP